LPGVLTTRVGGDGVGELIRGGDVVAPAGADISLFGGMASDGSLVVCGVEELHSSYGRAGGVKFGLAAVAP
jgi:hypothetical protein